MPLEIERKFVLTEAPGWLGDSRSKRIEQGYLALGEGEGTEVRLRASDDELQLTAKRGSGEVRREEEIELSREQFDSLWPLTEGRRVSKTRYSRDHDGLTIEIDVYRGALEGLITAEVEFASEESSREFEAPSWLGQEVTGNDRYANESLAVSGAPRSANAEDRS
jgi:adenylate cyclase